MFLTNSNSAQQLSKLQLGIDDGGRQVALVGREIVASLEKSGGEVLASNERINEGMRDVSAELGEVRQSVHQMQATLEWGFAEIVWRLDLYLGAILKVLRAPRGTQAEELRTRAERAYRNGWFEEARQDFEEAVDLNPYDFIAHLSLAQISAFHSRDVEEAIRRCDLAIKFADPESRQFAALARVLKADLLCDRGDYRAALGLARAALERDQEYGPAAYLAAHAALRTEGEGRESAIGFLQRAIDIDPLFAGRAMAADEFQDLREEIQDYVASCRDAIWRAAEPAYRAIEEAFEFIERRRKQYPNDEADHERLEGQVSKLRVLVGRNSLLDMIEVEARLPEAQYLATQGLLALASRITKRAGEVERDGEHKAKFVAGHIALLFPMVLMSGLNAYKHFALGQQINPADLAVIIPVIGHIMLIFAPSAGSLPWMAGLLAVATIIPASYAVMLDQSRKRATGIRMEADAATNQAATLSPGGPRGGYVTKAKGKHADEEWRENLPNAIFISILCSPLGAIVGILQMLGSCGPGGDCWTLKGIWVPALCVFLAMFVLEMVSKK